MQLSFFSGRVLTLYVIILLSLLAAFIAMSSVDNDLTVDDRHYISSYYLKNVAPLPDLPSYEDELRYIQTVQNIVLSIAPMGEGIPYGQPREPKELYDAGQGLCYDRSRVIEKILRYSGFETRHIALYSTEQTGSALKSILISGTASHAISEVKTQRGWIIVGSNTGWLSVDVEGNPISISALQRSNAEGRIIEWRDPPKLEIYLKPFTYIFGLYSRHGRFYPPYALVPDIEYKEFLQNFEM